MIETRDGGFLHLAAHTDADCVAAPTTTTNDLCANIQAGQVGWHTEPVGMEGESGGLQDFVFVAK